MITLKIITPSGLYCEKEVESIHVKTVEGERTILSNHIPLVAMLTISKLTTKQANQMSESYAIVKGMLHFQNNNATILTDAIEAKEEIDLQRAKSAKERAQKRLQEKANDTDLLRAEVALAKAMNRIHVKEGG